MCSSSYMFRPREIQLKTRVKRAMYLLSLMCAFRVQFTFLYVRPDDDP